MRNEEWGIKIEFASLKYTNYTLIIKKRLPDWVTSKIYDLKDKSDYWIEPVLSAKLRVTT